jgi:hypothetical protein
MHRTRRESLLEDEPMSDEEAARQRDEVVRRMLNTPPQPRKPKVKPK